MEKIRIINKSGFGRKSSVAGRGPQRGLVRVIVPRSGSSACGVSIDPAPDWRTGDQEDKSDWWMGWLLGRKGEK